MESKLATTTRCTGSVLSGITDIRQTTAVIPALARLREENAFRIAVIPGEIEAFLPLADDITIGQR